MQFLSQWWRDLFRCRIDLLNFSMGFNIVAPYMVFLHLNWHIAEWSVYFLLVETCTSTRVTGLGLHPPARCNSLVWSNKFLTKISKECYNILHICRNSMYLNIKNQESEPLAPHILPHRVFTFLLKLFIIKEYLYGKMILLCFIYTTHLWKSLKFFILHYRRIYFH